jgi:hypothetical protein
LLVAPLVNARLPDYMLGEFKMQTSEGFTDFMYALGVNWLTRSVRERSFRMSSLQC